MRNRIEFNHDSQGDPSLATAPRDLLQGDDVAQLRSPDRIGRTADSDRSGGIEAKVIQERTATPLKMVFIASVNSSSQETGASACSRLTGALTARGHRLLILQRQQKLKHQPSAGPQTVFYDSFSQLKDRFASEVRNADLVVIGSNVPEGAIIGEWVTRVAQGTTAFYDLDTPVTLAKLDRGESEHLSRSLLPRYQLYLSFTGGPLLELIQRYYGAPMVRPLYGSVDTSAFFPERGKPKWDLGYAGTFNEDRLPGMDELLLEPARHWPAGRFVVAGHGFPRTPDWPGNVKRFPDPAAVKQRAFYNAQRFTLNVTGADMIEAAFSPGLHIFEAAACGTPIISDYWEDLETFFTPDEQILFARSAEEVLDYLRGIGENERLRIGDSARRRVLAEHSAEQRAIELESYALEAMPRV